MPEIHPDLQANFIPMRDVHKHMDKICPPKKRRQLVRDIYKHTVKHRQKEEKQRFAG